AAPFLLGGLSSFVTDLVDDERRAYASDALSYNVASVGGPALVAVAVLLDSARAGMLTMAGVAAVGSIGLALLRLPPHDGAARSVRETIAQGFRHLVRHRPIAVVTASGTLSQLGGGAGTIVAVAIAIER
ncbi:MFS transporter, partial [Burkholderia cenocepacia]|uniref:hypothetical protein n=1 Tax=Burkholderia cenocepacia TaxID=95486 RepID=UPI0038CC0E06